MAQCSAIVRFVPLSARLGLGGSDWMKVFLSTVGENRTLFGRLIFGDEGIPFATEPVE